MYPKVQGDRKALVAARRPRNPDAGNKNDLKENCKSSSSMYPKVQGDRKALVAPAGAKSPCWHLAHDTEIS